MATITLKNIPELLYQRLKQRAEKNQRSLNSEVIICLEMALENNHVNPKALIKRARVLRSKISGQLTDDDLSLLKNQGRP